MCCTRLAENTGSKNHAKNRHLRTIAQLCWAISSQLRHVSTIGKKLVKWPYLLHMSLQYGEPQPSNGWDQFRSLGHPSKFQRVSRLGFVTALTSLNGGQPNLARCSAVSCTGILYVHFGGGGFLYWHHYCTALEQQASAKLCVVVHGMELRYFAEGATYIRLGSHHVGQWPAL